MRWRERLIAVGQIAVLGAVAVVSMATSGSYTDCRPGGKPLAGQSAVPVDAELTIVGPSLPFRGPRAGGSAIRLYAIEGGLPVERVITVHAQRSWPGKADNQEYEWRIEPEQPLAPDTLYRIVGVDRNALRSAHFDTQIDEDGWGVRWRVVDRHFFTGSAPRLLAALLGAESGARKTLRLVFSEPVDVDSVAGRVRPLRDGGFSVIGRPEPRGEQARVVRLVVEAANGQDVEDSAVSLDPGIIGASGVELEGYWHRGGADRDPLGAGWGLPIERMSDPGQGLAPSDYTHWTSVCTGYGDDL